MEQWDGLITLADRLGTLAVLLGLAIAFVTGRIPTNGHLADWRHYASQAEERARVAEQTLAVNTTELSKLTSTLESINRNLEHLSRDRRGQ